MRSIRQRGRLPIFSFQQILQVRGGIGTPCNGTDLPNRSSSGIDDPPLIKIWVRDTVKPRFTSKPTDFINKIEEASCNWRKTKKSCSLPTLRLGNRFDDEEAPCCAPDQGKKSPQDDADPCVDAPFDFGVFCSFAQSHDPEHQGRHREKDSEAGK